MKIANDGGWNAVVDGREPRGETRTWGLWLFDLGLVALNLASWSAIIVGMTVLSGLVGGLWLAVPVFAVLAGMALFAVAVIGQDWTLGLDAAGSGPGTNWFLFYLLMNALNTVTRSGS